MQADRARAGNPTFERPPLPPPMGGAARRGARSLPALELPRAVDLADVSERDVAAFTLAVRATEEGDEPAEMVNAAASPTRSPQRGPLLPGARRGGRAAPSKTKARLPPPGRPMPAMFTLLARPIKSPPAPIAPRLAGSVSLPQLGHVTRRA